MSGGRSVFIYNHLHGAFIQKVIATNAHPCMYGPTNDKTQRQQLNRKGHLRWKCNLK